MNGWCLNVGAHCKHNEHELLLPNVESGRTSLVWRATRRLALCNNFLVLNGLEGSSEGPFFKMSFNIISIISIDSYRVAWVAWWLSHSLLTAMVRPGSIPGLGHMWAEFVWCVVLYHATRVFSPDSPVFPPSAKINMWVEWLFAKYLM